MDLGHGIRAARLAAGLSLRETARRCHINPGYLSQIERGARQPSTQVLAALGGVLGRDLAEPAPIRSALELLLVDPQSAPPVTSPLVQELRRLDDHVGGVDSYPAVAAALGRSANPAVFAELAQVSGWVAADAGRHALALRHYTQGTSAARESGNLTAGANNVSSMAYLLAGTADAALLGQAATRIPGLPATMRCLAFERLAWACARSGNTDDCYRALDHADEAWSARVRGVEPDATYWLSDQEIQIMRGRCYVELRKPMRAIPALTAALTEYTWSPREDALYLTYLAEAYVQANEREAASELLDRARALGAPIRSARLTERLSSGAGGHST